MKDVDHYEIEKYFAKELTEQELIDFNKKLELDADFAKEVSLYKEINDVLENRVDQTEQNQLRDTLKNISNSNSKKEPKVFTLNNFSKYLVAASVLIFASILYFNMNTSSPTYEDFSKHSTLDLVVRGDADLAITKAQDAFNDENYSKAEQQFRAALFTQPENTELKIYLAVSLIEQNKFEMAQNVLSPIKNGKSIFKNKATWYSGLSYLKQNDKINCKKTLSTLPKDAEDYNKAQKIINKL